MGAAPETAFALLALNESLLLYVLEFVAKEKGGHVSLVCLQATCKDFRNLVRDR